MPATKTKKEKQSKKLQQIRGEVPEEIKKAMEDSGAIKQEDRFMLHLEVNNGEISISTKGGLQPVIAVNVLNNAIYKIAERADEAFVDTRPTPEQYKEFRQEMFDLINQCASGVLRLYAPEISLRPDLTEDAIAIVEAENRLMDETINKMEGEAIS